MSNFTFYQNEYEETARSVASSYRNGKTLSFERFTKWGYTLCPRPYRDKKAVIVLTIKKQRGATMGRKSGNITMQLNKRIDDLLRIGEKKVKDDPTNSNRVEGIHSVQTAST